MTHLLNFAAQKILLILLRHHNCAHCVFLFLSVILLYFIHFFSGSNSFKILKAFSLCTAARTASRPEKKKKIFAFNSSQMALFLATTFYIKT